jgi:hypothetical protein
MSILTSHARPVVLGVHSIHEFACSVPDLKQAEHFYRSFGLEVKLERDCLALYTFGHPHRWARIFQGEHKRLLWVSWGIYANDQKAFDQQLDAHQVTRTTAPQHASAGGIWFVGPDGLPQQLLVSEKSSPDTKSPRIFAPEISTSGRAPHRSEDPDTSKSPVPYLAVYRRCGSQRTVLHRRARLAHVRSLGFHHRLFTQ